MLANYTFKCTLLVSLSSTANFCRVLTSLCVCKHVNTTRHDTVLAKPQYGIIIAKTNILNVNESNIFLTNEYLNIL